MPTPGDLMQQVRDYLTTVYHGTQSATTSGTAAPASPNAPVLAFEPIGMPVSAADLQLNENDPASPILASIGLQRTSEYSNWVPELDADGNLQVSALTVAGQYDIVLEESQALTSAAADAFDAIKAPAKKAFEQALTQGLDTSGTGGDLQFYPVYPTPADWYNAANQANWASTGFGTQNPTTPVPAPPPGTPTPPRPTLPWRGITRPIVHPPVCDPGPVRRFPQMTAAAIDESPVDRMAMPLRVQTAVSQTLDSSPPVHLATSPQPPRPIDATFEQNRFALQNWKQMVHVTQSTPPQPTQSDGLSVSFDYCLVHLARPWLSADFLSSSGWYLPGALAASISNGVDLSGAYKFSSIPAAFIAVKKLSITANWSAADKTAAESAVAIGQFSLAGHSFDGATLSCPGIQIIAWVCERIPAIPPSADPALTTVPTPAPLPAPSPSDGPAASTTTAAPAPSATTAAPTSSPDPSTVAVTPSTSP